MKKAMKVTFSFFCLIVVLLALVILTGCSRGVSGPTPLPTVAPSPVSAGCTITGSNNNVNCGNGGTITVPSSPTASPSPGGDNVVTGFAIFCYGFGAKEPQPEPNHDQCIAPPGYPEVAVTASPKNAAKVDAPNPGDKTDAKIIDWRFEVTPAGAATLVIQADNRFNARVVPAEKRVPGTVFSLTAVYTDPQKNVWVATKSGGIN